MDLYCGLWDLLLSWPKSRKKSVLRSIGFWFFFFSCRQNNFVTCIYVTVCVAYNGIGNVNFVLG